MKRQRRPAKAKAVVSRWEPTTTLSELAPAYRAKVERLAEQLAPRFRKREFRGFNDKDSERCSKSKRFTPPLWKLENEIKRRVVKTNAVARLLWACSPSADRDKECIDVRATAAWAMAFDVLKIAGARGWYRPEPDEEPSLRDLGVS